jgi:hypothetical protein
MPELRTALGTLVLAVTFLFLPAQAAPQQGPDEVYRAWWASGLVHDEPGWERFWSRASISELADFRAETPEIAEAALAFLEEAHRALSEAAVPGRIEVVQQDAAEAFLHVRFEGRDGALPAGFPSEASVLMVWEEDGWKVREETYEGSVPGRLPDSDPPDEGCPAEAVLGDPSDPHRLLVSDSDAAGTVHFGAAYMLRDGDHFALHLPPFNEHHLRVEVRSGEVTPGSHSAVLSGTRWPGGCPALPEALVDGDPPVGELEWQPFDGSALARISFAFRDPDSGAGLLSGSLGSVPLIDATPGPVGEGSLMVTLDGREIVPDRGRVLFHEGEGRLEVMLEYTHANGGGSTSLSVSDFRGQIGVYVGDSWFDSREVTVVRAFGGDRVELEVREIPEDALPDGELDAEMILGMGTLKARVVTHRLVTVPTLPPVGS